MAEAQQKYPSARPATDPALTHDEATSAIQEQVTAALAEADEIYDGDDPVAAEAFVYLRTRQAERQVWNRLGVDLDQVKADARLDRGRQSIGAQPEAEQGTAQPDGAGATPVLPARSPAAGRNDPLAEEITAETARSAAWATLVPSPPGVTWLRAPRDTYLHAQAAAAAPTAEGWQTLLAHSKNGAVLDGDTLLDGQAIARRYPMPTILLACDGALQAGADLHAATGQAQEVVAPRGHAIMLPNGRVIAGSWTIGPGGKPVPVANGSFVHFKNGVPRTLGMGTPYLDEAMASRGVALRPGGEPPERAVGFYYELTEYQSAALCDREVRPDDLAAADQPGSLYRSLIALAESQLRAVLGQRPDAGAGPRARRDRAGGRPGLGHVPVPPAPGGVPDPPERTG